MVVYCAIEGGGTSWRVALVKDDPTDTANIEMGQFVTTENPEEVMGQIKHWLKGKHYDALGIATFGPLDAKVGSKDFGKITTTPKPGWQDTDVVGYFWDGKTPMLFDTDVNAPALAEYMYGNPAGTSSCAYITVGTGIGVGLVVNGKPVHGMMHPEAGHLSFCKKEGVTYEGACSYHCGCVEGYACTLGISGFKGVDKTSLASLKDEDPVWDTVAHALGSLCYNLILTVSPERIVISGGVMNREILYEKIRVVVKDLLKGYIKNPLVEEKIDQFIVPSTWGQKAGVVGTLTLAKCAYEESLESMQSVSTEPNLESKRSKPMETASISLEKLSPLLIGAAVGALAVVGLSHMMKCPFKK
mmetsp:Transcript_28709/g.37657  ORF Transcript_28709/g.37657 Transcript_28709/m.37657 type:complete len:358 (+) Transcript_28709:92-1165(+)